MIFRVERQGQRISKQPEVKRLQEVQLEKLIVGEEFEGTRMLPAEIFAEDLLFITRQHFTDDKKRTDVIALDQQGNLVAIELKRDQARLGVDTQALQYLAYLSGIQGREVLRKFEKVEGLENKIRGFLGDAVSIDQLNPHPRVILLARGFDEALLSMGEWLSAQGVAFRCISYSQHEIAGEIFLSFSMRFDRSPRNLHRVRFGVEAREPAYFWLNIGQRKRGGDKWWDYLKKVGEIACGFDGQAGDRGEQILTSLIPGDRILAYSSGHGAIGWGEVPPGAKYRLLRPGDPGDFLNGVMLHRLRVQWHSFADNISNAIKPAYLRSLDIAHPVQTCVSINRERAEKLIAEMNKKFQSTRRGKA